MLENNLSLIRRFVGPVTADQLKYVDAFMSGHLAVCIPSIGPCFLATTPDHPHLASAFVLAGDDACRIATPQGVVEQPPGSVMAMSPSFVHHEVAAEVQPRYIAVLV